MYIYIYLYVYIYIYYGGLIIGAHYTIIIVRNPENSVGSYLGPILPQCRSCRGPTKSTGECYGTSGSKSYVVSRS